MKRAITFYIDDDVDLVAFCGALCIKTKDFLNGTTMMGLSDKEISECSEWYIPVKGKAEPYKAEKEESHGRTNQ